MAGGAEFALFIYLILRNEGGTNIFRRPFLWICGRLLDEIGTNEQHLLYEPLDKLGALIQTYNKRYRMPEPNGAGAAGAAQQQRSSSPTVNHRADLPSPINGARQVSFREEPFWVAGLVLCTTFYNEGSSPWWSVK